MPARTRYDRIRRVLLCAALALSALIAGSCVVLGVARALQGEYGSAAIYILLATLIVTQSIGALVDDITDRT